MMFVATGISNKSCGMEDDSGTPVGASASETAGYSR
jgi:hypothetical protein